MGALALDCRADKHSLLYGGGARGVDQVSHTAVDTYGTVSRRTLRVGITEAC